jgi:sialate O-acetylesterase
MRAVFLCSGDERFVFSNAAMPNLFSKAGLPINLFRTDDWPVDTEAVKQ